MSRGAKEDEILSLRSNHSTIYLSCLHIQLGGSKILRAFFIIINLLMSSLKQAIVTSKN